MLERYNRFVATDDPEEFRYWHILKRMNIVASAEPFVADGDFGGYTITLRLAVKGELFGTQRRIPIGSIGHLPDDSLEEYVDFLYSDMISELFGEAVKYEA